MTLDTLINCHMNSIIVNCSQNNIYFKNLPHSEIQLLYL